MPYETTDPESRLCYQKVHFLTMTMLERFTRNCVLVSYASDITNCCALQRLARYEMKKKFPYRRSPCANDMVSVGNMHVELHKLFYNCAGHERFSRH